MRPNVRVVPSDRGHGLAESPAQHRESVLALSQLVKRYGDVIAVDGVDVAVERGEFLTLLGPSGSGKTTILKMIAGFETPTGGRITLEGTDIAPLPPAQRGIGIVFQNYALFPHMTVADNIRYPLKLRRWSKADRARRLDEMLKLIQLGELGPRYPKELSGGQQQRVALARALAFRPTLLLMDEPLGALDRALRLEMEEEIRRIHRELQTTIIYVTHDQEEALALSDRIAIMREGKILQVGPPRELFEKPVDTFVASFFGDCTILALDRRQHEAVVEGRGRVALFGSQFDVPEVPSPLTSPRRLMIRPHRLRLASAPGDVSFSATVSEVIYLGGTTRLRCASPDADMVVVMTDADRASHISIGDTVRLYFKPSDGLIIPTST